jgi:hypothetical protein
MPTGGCTVFKPTVYPGVPEEVCVPLLERESGFLFSKDLTMGYSPECINHGAGGPGRDPGNHVQGRRARPEEAISLAFTY